MGCYQNLLEANICYTQPRVLGRKVTICMKKCYPQKKVYGSNIMMGGQVGHSPWPLPKSGRGHQNGAERGTSLFYPLFLSPTHTLHLPYSFSDSSSSSSSKEGRAPVVVCGVGPMSGGSLRRCHLLIFATETWCLNVHLIYASAAKK